MTSGNTAVLPAGEWVASSRDFKRPLKFSVRARMIDSRPPDCLAFNVFADKKTDRESGYMFGPGFFTNEFVGYDDDNKLMRSGNITNGVKKKTIALTFVQKRLTLKSNGSLVQLVVLLLLREVR